MLYALCAMRSADVEFCKKNDKYGLYEKADEGMLKHFAGVDEVYDVPEEPNIVINSKTRNKEINKVVEIIA